MAASKGMIFIDSKSAILFEQLHPRIKEGKRSECELVFSDFDDVSFKISCVKPELNIITLNVVIMNIHILKSLGSQAVIDRLFPGAEVAPLPGYNFALQFDCDSLQEPDKFINDISEIKRHLIGGPLDNAFSKLLENQSESLALSMVQYRHSEAMFICPSASKIVVIFLIDFADPTDKAIARVFLQEFLEAQRTIRNAPPVSFSKDAPGELSKLKHPFSKTSDTAAGYLSFAIEERHITGANKDKAITLLTGFRNYLHYHIKCSKTYLHMRMRKRVVGWMQVTNDVINCYLIFLSVACGVFIRGFTVVLLIYIHPIYFNIILLASLTSAKRLAILYQ